MLQAGAQPGKNTLPYAPHPEAHWRRVRDEVARMIEEVPLYKERPAPPAEATAEAVSAWLASMPTIAKKDLRRGFPKSMVRSSCDLKDAMAKGLVEIIATSGTTQDRLQVLWENAWWDPQEREAMRLHATIARVMPEGKTDFREAVLTTPVCGGATCHIGNLSRAERTVDGMLFLNQVADPTHWTPAELDRMVLEWNELEPEGVEADPAYLAALCRHVTASGGRLHSPDYVTLTYELATRGHHRAIKAVIDSPLVQLYGATEAGVLFMQCDDGLLRHSVRHSHIELLDVGGGLGRVVVTTLGRTWMPLLRYDLGDLVRLAPGENDGYVFQRIEGRSGDAVPVRDRLITPAEIDDALDAAEPTITMWQLAREGAGFTLRVCDSDGTAAARALSTLLETTVTPRREAAILPEGSGKYRLVRPT
jgi:phenylacetate-CoA ligase